MALPESGNYWEGRPAQPPGVGGAFEKLFCSPLGPAASDGGFTLAWLKGRGTLSHHFDIVKSLNGRLSADLRACHEFEPSTTKDPPCRGVMHVKSIESSNVLPLLW
ncbi:hypothetical protein TNCV_4629051 [Trichonephila clavipes]|nr:hypothetical protein TNCV_4629051 [Trichonephila clavipes]